MKWLIEFLKWKIAGRELEQLHRLKADMMEYRSWLNEFPEIAAVLDNLAVRHGFHRGLVFDNCQHKGVAELRKVLRVMVDLRHRGHDHCLRRQKHRNEQLLNVLRYYRDHCTGAEPSLSVFQRMVDEALSEKKGASDDF